MVINSSQLALEASRNYQSYTQTQAASVETKGSEAVSLEISDEAKSLLEQMNQDKEENELPKKAFTFGSVSIKSSSSNTNVVVSDLRGTVSAAAGTGGTLFTKTTAISSIF